MVKGGSGNQTHLTSASFSRPATSVILVLVVNGHKAVCRVRSRTSLGTLLTYTLDKQAGSANATL
jgi:hypothetical protein